MKRLNVELILVWLNLFSELELEGHFVLRVLRQTGIIIKNRFLERVPENEKINLAIWKTNRIFLHSFKMLRFSKLG